MSTGVMSMGVPAPDDGLPVLVEAVRADVATAAGYLDAIIGGAESVLTLLGADAVVVVRADLAALHAQSRDLQRWIGEAMRSIGDPAALRAAAVAWSRQVAAPVGALAGLATLNTAEVDDHWSGPAADAYRNTLPAQAAALTATAGIGDEVNTDLIALADAITLFWAAVGTAINVLIVGLAVALASAATVAGTPLAVAASIGAVTACVTMLATALAALVNLDIANTDHAAALQRRLDTTTAFPLGAWPRSTTPISIHAGPGDDTDWHPTR